MNRNVDVSEDFDALFLLYCVGLPVGPFAGGEDYDLLAVVEGSLHCDAVAFSGQSHIMYC